MILFDLWHGHTADGRYCRKCAIGVRGALYFSHKQLDELLTIQCAGIKKNGNKCTNPAGFRSKYCGTHHKED